MEYNNTYLENALNGNITTELQERLQKINNTKGNLSKEDEDLLILVSQKTGGIFGDDIMYMKQYSSIEKIVAAFAFSHHENQDREDYVHDCYESLKEAMQKYRFSEKVRFNTYLSIIIRRDLNDNWYKKNPCSKYYQQQNFLIDEFREEYYKANGTYPTDAVIAEALGYSLDRLYTIRYEAIKCYPIYFEEIEATNDVDMYDNDGLTSIDEIYMDPALRVLSPEESLIESECNHELHSVLKDLGPGRADILYRIAGVGKYGKAQSKAQIMRETGMSKQRLNKMLEQILPYAQSRLVSYYK